MTETTARTFGAAGDDGELAADPDLAPVGDEGSDLDELAAELAAEVTPTVTIPVPGRPRYSASYRLDFTGKDLDTYRKRAKDKTFTDGVDGVRFASILLAATNTAVLRDNVPIDLDGRTATFRERAFLDLLGATGAADGVKRLYSLDGHIDATARRVMADAGWGDELDAMGPTE